MGLIDTTRLSGWFEAYSKVLVLYAGQWLASEPSEDVVQEVFIRLLSQRAEPANIKAWLFHSVRNAAISRIRSRRRRLLYERQRAGEYPAWFEPRPEDLVDAGTAQSALLSLPNDQREIIVLRIWAGMTLAEASEVTGEPVSTLFSRYRAGLAALRKAMEVSCKSKKD
ncbi:MAG: RNA polymerase sigma factor [Planctomycetota bacterium]|jgi:RNA polymerase sigma-70 factor (ECF subfamily)